MSEWQMRRLGDLIDIRGGLSYKSKYIDSGDAKLLGMGCVSFSQRFLQGGCRSYAGDYTEKHLVEEGDLVIATRQQSENLPILGFPAMIPSGMNGTDIIVGTNLYKVDNQSNFANSFLFWLMRGEGYRSHVKACASGSTVRMITKDVILDYCFACPAEKEAEAIATFLDRIEDKIELNQKMNQTLEEIAKAIFKSWFVDFDPVRAKAEGRPTGLPPEISDLFPDKLVDSEIGEIPKGWSVGAIADFASLNKKTINPSQSSEIYEHFSIPAFDSGQSPALDLGTDIKSNKTLVPEGSLLVSKLNPNTPRVWLPNPRDLHEQICSTEFMVYTATDHSNIAFLWGLFTSSLVAGRMEAMVTGTSKSHQRVKPNDVSGIMTVTPDARLVKTYGDTILPMLNRTLVGKSESTVLSELRDTLLPKLISGELRIPDAEKFLEEAGI